MDRREAGRGPPPARSGRRRTLHRRPAPGRVRSRRWTRRARRAARVCRAAPGSATDLEAAQVRQVDVEQHQVGALLGDDAERLGARSRLDHLVARAAQAPGCARIARGRSRRHSGCGPATQPCAGSRWRPAADSASRRSIRAVRPRQRLASRRCAPRGGEHPLLLAAEGLRRQHDDRDVRGQRILLEPCEHLEAAHLGHDEVENDGVRALRARPAEEPSAPPAASCTAKRASASRVRTR